MALINNFFSFFLEAVFWIILNFGLLIGIIFADNQSFYQIIMHSPITTMPLTTCKSKDKKRDLKEKIVQIYESLFKEEQSNLVVNIANNEPFWNEFFLLRANPKALLEIIDNLENADLSRCKTVINLIFTKSVLMLDFDSYIKVANASVTLLTLSKRLLIPSSNISNSLDILMGNTNLDVKINLLSNKLYALLVSEHPFSLRSLVLKIYSTFLMCCDDIDTNPFADQLMSGELFDVFISLLASPVARHYFGYQVIVLMTILINHKSSKVTHKVNHNL